MSMDTAIYAAVVRRLAERDHGWGKPYAFPALYVLDHAVPGVEDPGTIIRKRSAQKYNFDEALQAALQARMVDLPTITFVHGISDVYEAKRPGHIQVRDGGAFIGLGPVERDGDSAVVGAYIYCGHLWARWIRYYLEHTEITWQIADTQLMGLS
jgi:hypothetical protein